MSLALVSPPPPSPPSHPGVPLKVINLWGAPGAGKSTTAAALYNLMKHAGMAVELVTEFAKDRTYQRDHAALANQLYCLAEQDMRLRRLAGQVEWAICDSPLPLCLAYASDEYGEWFASAVEGAFYRYENFDVLVRRVKPFQEFGRTQDRAASDRLAATIATLFEDFSEDDMCVTVDGDPEAPWTIAEAFNLPIDEHDGLEPGEHYPSWLR